MRCQCLVRWCLLLASALPAAGEAASGQLLLSTRIDTEPWGIAVDRTGVLRADFWLGGAQLSIHYDATTLTETARFPDPGTSAFDAPRTHRSGRATLQGLIQGHASLESQSFNVRDANGSLRWSVPAAAGHARPDGSAFIHQNSFASSRVSSRVCSVGADGAVHWCRELTTWYGYPASRVLSTADGGGLVAWVQPPLGPIPVGPHTAFLGRFAANGELQWCRQIVYSDHGDVPEMAVVGDDIILAASGRAGTEILRVRGSDGQTAWKRLPSPPRAGVAIHQVKPDGEGAAILWVDGQGAFALERIGATGARHFYRRLPPIKNPQLQSFPGTGVAVFDSDRATDGPVLHWFDPDGAYRWQTRFEPDSRIDLMLVTKPSEVLVALSRGRTRPVSQIQKFSTRSGTPLGRVSLERWWRSPQVNQSIRVRDELWQLAIASSVDLREAFLVRASADGLRYQPIESAYDGRLHELDGPRQTQTAALLESDGSLTALDAQGERLWRLSNLGYLDRVAVRPLNNGQLSVLFTKYLSEEVSPIERWRVDDRTGTVLQRDLLSAGITAGPSTPLRQSADGGAILIQGNSVFRMLPDGSLRETARLPIETGWRWVRRWPDPGNGLLAQYFPIDYSPPALAGGFPQVLINADGIPRWIRYTPQEPGPVIALGDRLFTVMSETPTSRLTELHPETGIVLRRFEPPPGLPPGNELTTAGGRIEYLAVERSPLPTYCRHQYVVVNVDPDTGQSSRVGSPLPVGCDDVRMWQGPHTRHVRIGTTAGTWIVSERRP